MKISILIRLLSFCLFFFIPIILEAQISLPAEVCLEQKFIASNLASTGEINWDFCEGDLLLAPTLTQGISNSFNIPVGTCLIKSSGKWYGFITSLSNNSLFRLDLGTSLLNSSPAVVNLGNIGGLLNNPQEIKVVEFQANFYAFVFNKSVNKLIRINLGSDIETTTATATSIVSGNGFDNGGLDVAFDGLNWVASITNLNTLTLVNLGNSPANNPGAGDILNTSTIPGVNSIGDIKFIKDGSSWFGFIVGYSSATLHRLDFGTGLFIDPVPTNLKVFSFAPYGLTMAKENGKWVMFVPTLQGNFQRLDFGVSPTNATPTLTSLGNLGGATNTLKMDMATADSRWVALSTNWNSKNYYLIEFPQTNCPFDKSFSSANQETLEALTSGSFFVSFYEKNSDGIKSIVTHQIETLNKTSPDLDLSSTSLCEDVAGVFTPVSDQQLVSVSWNFGVYGNSTDTNPAITFNSSGIFPIQLEGVSDNGCHNLLDKSIEIYQPLDNIDFTLPPGLVCTNNELTFTNNIVDTYGGNLSYEWFVDGNPTGSQRDLKYTLTAAQDYQIKLKASIPGCFDEVTQTLQNVGAGPIIDFSFSGHCEDEAVQFTSGITETVTSYDWEFNGTTFSTDEDPSHTFTDIGSYSVTLTALSPSGCNNSKTKSVPIYTKPIVDFKIDPPPQACSGSTTAFIDLTIDPADSDLQSWQWNFGDTGAGNTAAVQNPSHTYANAGMYTVSLTAATNAGCSASWEEQITISQSPAVTIGNSPTCVGVPVNFSATGSDIKSYYWEMGTLYYEVANPVHTFNATGNQSVKLTIQGNNNCIMVYNRLVTVPVVLSPDFSVTDNCTGFEAVFTDITTGTDPVVQRTWDFAGLGTSSDQSASFEFATIGNKNIKLTVATQAGCSYSKNKSISVVTPPVAAFTASPESGGTPLFVQFNNTSTGATSYNWSIDEGSIFTTDQVSPSYTFTETGSFLVTLAASGPQGCTSIIVKEINTTAGLPDVDLKLITTSENADGTIKVIITVQNKGNTVLRNLPVVIDISGNVSLTETIAGPISPASMYNLILGYGLNPNDNLKFLCAETTLENDQTPEGNRICREFDDGVFLFNAYPNPAKGVLTIEWVAPKDEVITISLVDSSGKKIVLSEVNSLEGLNSSRLSLDNIKNGLYILRIQGASLLKTQRIFVSGQN
jgi:PKD repeat protein